MIPQGCRPLKSGFSASDLRFLLCGDASACVSIHSTATIRRYPRRATVSMYWLAHRPHQLLRASCQQTSSAIASIRQDQIDHFPYTHQSQAAIRLCLLHVEAGTSVSHQKMNLVPVLLISTVNWLDIVYFTGDARKVGTQVDELIDQDWGCQ